ncbi:hypothetical protein Ddye_015204 [Dipteronia dyeriana]|uniref:Uncharacterized protein n=1 Tax=Dipteronia dyeriana TaxID=168575 RepID=A0AAD9WZB8_9ROSI|nr:hypothetical protein Ddye_015204 [Dipteronia dyeriana]
MDEPEKRTDFADQGLIDVSFEDDSLINSSFVSPQNHKFSESQEQKSVRFLESFDASNGETPFNSREERKEEFEPLESLEAENTRKAGKYNLRKSLAWDKAFFTCEGVLEPEELSSMIRVGSSEKSEKHVLPGIEEDVHGSTDSLSTLESDTLTMKSLEADLFEDIRASIQKSSKMSNVKNSKSNQKLGPSESKTTQPSTVDLSSRDKMKPKAAPPKKPIVGTQGSGKAVKQVSVRPQPSQSVATNGESTSSICKPPKVLGRVSPYSTISTKRASLGANRLKMEKDNPKISSGAIRGAAVSKTPSSGSRNILPRPTLPSRSLHTSAATKQELTSSCSSFDSSGSASSDISKLSMNSTKLRIDSGTCSPSSSGSTVKSKARLASKSKNQPGSSHLTASLRSVSKLSSNISPASSISERSSGLQASNATANQRPKNMRVSLDSRPLKGVSVGSDASQMLDSLHNSNDKCSVGDDAKVPCLQGERLKGASTGTAALRPLARPSGLRMPSPKIGFFDGVRSSGRTPTGSMQSQSGPSSALPKTGTGSVSPSGGLIKAKLGNLQPARTAMSMKSPKPDVQHTVLTTKSRPSLPLQEPSNAATKAPSKNIKGALVSPKLQRSVSATIGGNTPSKSEQVVCKGHESPADFGLSEKKGSPNVSNDKLYSESKGQVHVPGIKFSPMNEQLNASDNSSFNSEVENINPSQKVGGDVNFGQHIPKNDLYPLCDANEKEKTSFEDQVGGGLTEEVGVRDIHVVVEKTITLPSP